MTGSPYSPLKNARLRKIVLKAGGDAATSLIDGVVRIRLTCPKFSGVYAYVLMSGQGLRTATCPPIEAEQVVDLPVETGVPITIEMFQDTGATPVTPRFNLLEVFEG
jgi:hypothetical protein